MKKQWSLLLVLLFLGSSAMAESSVSREDVLGNWFRSEFSDNEVFFEEVEYLDSGRKCTVSHSILASGEAELSYYESAWQLVNDEIRLMVRKSSSIYVPPGQAITDRIDSLDSESLVNQMIEPVFGSKKEVYFRSPYKRAGEVCDWVDRLEEQHRKARSAVRGDAI